MPPTAGATLRLGSGQTAGITRSWIGKSVENKWYAGPSQNDILPPILPSQRTPYFVMFWPEPTWAGGVQFCIRGLKYEYGCRESS